MVAVNQKICVVEHIYKYKVVTSVLTQLWYNRCEVHPMRRLWTIPGFEPRRPHTSTERDIEATIEM